MKDIGPFSQKLLQDRDYLKIFSKTIAVQGFKHEANSGNWSYNTVIQNINYFLIQYYAVNLKLPPDKKTHNNFVFITNGSMTRNLGIESFELQKNDFLFTPKNSITTTEFVSAALEDFFIKTKKLN